jgi:hypothetical protein
MKVNLLLKGLKILLFPGVIIVKVKKAVLFQPLDSNLSKIVKVLNKLLYVVTSS